MMKFTIVMPVFNCESTIERAIESVVRQDWNDLDLIFMDGGSRDKTVEIASKYKHHFSHFVSEKDRGQTHAINKGFALGKGQIYNWLCGDDEFTPDTFRRVAEKFAANPESNVLVGAADRIYGTAKRETYAPQPNVFDRISYFNGIEQPSCFWTADLHRKTGPLDESLGIGMDWDWWNRLKQAGAKPITTSDIYSLYYFPETSKTSSDPEGNLRLSYYILKRYGPLGGHLADVYRYLFDRYDMKGCYDDPPSAPKDVMLEFWRDVRVLKDIFGKELIYSYNWNWMSKQLRGLPWF